jgi:hypothetical protein
LHSATRRSEIASVDSLWFHPKIVHVPIALGILMPLIASGLLLAWWRNWLPSRAFFVAVALQAILAGTAYLGMWSGDEEEDVVEKVVSHDEIEKHEEAAELFLYGSCAVLVVMAVAAALGARRYGKGIALVATLGTFVVAGLCFRTGQLGGNLVYKYNAPKAYIDTDN